MAKYGKIKKAFNKLLREHIEVINLHIPNNKKAIVKFKNDWKVKAGLKK
jgi:hypothetical protein